jgi:hypothetical protein
MKYESMMKFVSIWYVQILCFVFKIMALPIILKRVILADHTGARPKARNVFARSDTGIVGSNLFEAGMSVFIVCLRCTL